MSRNNISVFVWLNQTKLNKKGLAPLVIRITFNRERKTISTGYSIDPSKWDIAKYRVKGTCETADQINDYIQQSQSKLISLYNEMLKEGDINLNKLVERFFGRDITPMTLLELIKYHNDDFYKRIGIDYTHSTFEKYDILRKKLELFIPLKYGIKDMRLRDLSYVFAADFDFYLKDNDKNQHNTVVKYIINLKKVLNFAVTHNWIVKNPISKFKATYKDVERIYLTLPELQSIEQKSFKMERLELVKDLFLFQCYTGLAYSDMALLTEKDVSLGIDGNKWIIIRRKKTDIRSVIPLLPMALTILDKYSSDRRKNRLLPCYAIQKFNSYLQEIADLCEISKRITSHVGRRTFATTVALANGVSLETISKILGHSSTKITHQYAVVTDMKVSEEMNRLKDKI
jgi:site-specific recombinase XerD